MSKREVIAFVIILTLILFFLTLSLGQLISNKSKHTEITENIGLNLPESETNKRIRESCEEIIRLLKKGEIENE